MSEQEEETSGEQEAKAQADHDGAYRRLFAHPEMVEQLVGFFVDEELASRLDFERMTRWRDETRNTEGAPRRADMLWRVPLKDAEDEEEGELVVMVHLEFQSKTEPSMALRMLEYVVGVYVDLARERSQLVATRSLPPVLPIVLYNGRSAWSAAQDIRELIRVPSALDVLERFVPRMRYVVLDAVRLARARAGEDTGLPGLLFALEAVEGPDDLRLALESLREVTAGEDGLRDSFLAWGYDVLYTRSGLDLTGDEFRALLEKEDSMFAETVERLFKEKHEEGLEQGRAEGRAAMLEKLLEYKFGVDETRAQRLGSLGEEQLDALGLALFELDDEDTLFEVIMAGEEE